MGQDYYEIKTPATDEPVSLADAKSWCKITHASEDALITSLIKAATAKAELYTNRIFIERTYTGFFSCLDCSKFEKGFYFAIRRGPLKSITHIEVTVDDAQVIISTDDYDEKKTHGFSRIIFSEISDNPDDIPYPYQIEFVAGYGNAVAVPEPIKTAIKQYVCFLYSNKGDCAESCAKSGGIPEIVTAILNEYRIVNTYG